MKKQILGAMVLAAVSSFALAAAPAFSEVDTDANGSISAEEASVVDGLDFDAADKDADGSLSVEEYAAATAE
ncbi:MAG: calmodulin [Gammaproteobacteria bacterium]|nr:calmodulin [Gammaproteobacteria bacterium]